MPFSLNSVLLTQSRKLDSQVTSLPGLSAKILPLCRCLLQVCICIQIRNFGIQRRVAIHGAKVQALSYLSTRHENADNRQRFVVLPLNRWEPVH